MSIIDYDIHVTACCLCNHCMGALLGCLHTSLPSSLPAPACAALPLLMLLLLLLPARLGKGDKNSADQAAVDMMRKVLNDIPMVKTRPPSLSAFLSEYMFARCSMLRLIMASALRFSMQQIRTAHSTACQAVLQAQHCCTELCCPRCILLAGWCGGDWRGREG